MTRKRLVMVFSHLLIIIVINICFIDSLDLRTYGMVYLLYSIYTLGCLLNIQKKIITPVNILYGTFILFQTGVPIAYFIKENYSNFYMSLFSKELVLNAAKYTLWSIEAFSLIIVMKLNPNYNKRKNIIFSKISAVNNTKYVYSIARIIFIATSIIIVPLYAYVAYLSVQFGFSQAIRSMVATNSFFNLIRAFFFPSFFLLECYGKEFEFTNVAKYLYIITCIFALLSGNRADGIVWLITYFYYDKTETRNTIKNKIIMFLGIIAIIFIAVYIGQTRMGTESVDSSSIVINLIGEMGFNFFSICFVMLFVPSVRGFQYGISYLESFICMLPKSCDFLHLFDSMRANLPAQWLYNINHKKFGELLDFGTGFSMIGESYMNFAWGGFLMSGVYAVVLCEVFNGKWMNDSNWEKYVQMIMFLALLTFPRRGFIEFLNIIFYSIFFITLLLVLFYRKK